MKRARSSSILLIAALVSGACGFQHATSITAPSGTGTASNTPAPTPTPGTGTGGSSATSLVGVWTSQAVTPTLPSPTSCGNFQYQIASQTSNSIRGTFTASCGNGLVVSANAEGQLSGSNVALTMTGSGTMSNLPICNFTVTGNGSIEDNGYTLSIPYSGTTCLGPVHGTEVLRRPQPQAAPVPTPTPAPPTPAPQPPPGPTGPTDGIDLRPAIITGGSPGDVAYWPITTKIDAMDFGNGVHVDFSKKDGAGRWPDVTPPGWDGPLQYTLWMVVNIGGQWYTSGGAEFWYGLDRTGGPAAQFASNWYYEPLVWGPLANHQPANGEQTGFFVTAGDARVKDVHTVRERSNVVVMPFPSGGGYFTFSLARTR